MVAETEREQAEQESDSTIPDVLADSVREQGSGIYLIDGSGEHGFAEVAERAERVRGQLIDLGIKPLDRVVLWLPNGLDWVASFFAVLGLGATVVPAGTRLRTPDLEHVLADSDARALIYAPSFLGIDFDRMVAEIVRIRASGGLASLKHLLAVDPTSVASAVRLQVEGGTAADRDRPARAVAPTDPAVACYTSGTSGRPKGCVHTHGALVRNARIAADLTGLGPGERIACPVPFAHIFGFHMGVLQAAASGATLINAEPYSPEHHLDLCEARRATVAYLVPTMAREMLAAQGRSPRKISIRLALVAGAPVSPGLRTALTGSRGISKGLSVVYGCTEAPTISQLLPDDPEPQRQRSVGRPTPGVEVRIAGRGRSDALPTGEAGEILVRGYSTMVGYLGDSAATERRFRDGWLITGDLGRFDEQGYLEFLSRADDTILVGGFNAYPKEIESQLDQLEAVDEVAVIGVPDERLGQVPMAWVEADRSLLGPDAVLEWSTHNLASYKRPRYVKIVERLPRVASGKIARVRLMERARRELPALPWEGANQ